jgi:hypothetical protein
MRLRPVPASSDAYHPSERSRDHERIAKRIDDRGEIAFSIVEQTAERMVATTGKPSRGLGALISQASSPPGSLRAGDTMRNARCAAEWIAGRLDLSGPGASRQTLASLRHNTAGNLHNSTRVIDCMMFLAVVDSFSTLSFGGTQVRGREGSSAPSNNESGRRLSPEIHRRAREVINGADERWPNPAARNFSRS